MTLAGLGKTVGRSRWAGRIADMLGPGRLWLLLGMVLVLAGLGFWIKSSIREIAGDNLGAGVTALRDANRSALTRWLDGQRSAALSAVADEENRTTVLGIVNETSDDHDVLRDRLKDRLEGLVNAHGFWNFTVVDENKVIRADQDDRYVGMSCPLTSRGLLTPVFQGRAMVSPPFRMAKKPMKMTGDAAASEPMPKKGEGIGPTDALMFAAAPIKDDTGRVRAALAFLIDPEQAFSEILAVGHVGDSGETYVFDDSGLMLSHSRFDDDLSALGLIPADAPSGSMLNLELRDPGVDLTSGKQPDRPRHSQEFTYMFRQAMASDEGHDIQGYRGYRGRRVIGAWTSLPEYDMRLATEIDFDEAFEPMLVLRRNFWALFVVIAVIAMLMVGSSWVIARLRSTVLEVRQLGQYTIEEKIGEGGMGQVFKARHSLMRRPTAIKLLRQDTSNPETLGRFEREVQLTSQLSHPNTIAIYDYGHTPERVFYYAMEYLEGETLETLARVEGPQPENRVMHFTRQICGSLAEAHRAGLIHRDIKPANIMVCERGGQLDVVKVLDFGLVKEVSSSDSAVTMSAANTLTGTPLYMSPEAIRTPHKVDERSDLYSFGALVYYMVTGTHVFEGQTVIEVCSKHLNDPPESPSKRLGREIHPEMERCIMACLEKDPAKRPQSAREILDSVEQGVDAGMRWTQQDAEARWARFRELRDSMDADALAIATARTATATPEIAATVEIGLEERRGA